MSKTNVRTLGTEYTVTDPSGSTAKTIRIIPQSDILDAAIGKLEESDFDNYADYIEKSLAELTGFEGIDPNKIYWHATYSGTVVLANVIEYAYKNGYDIVILERLE